MHTLASIVALVFVVARTAAEPTPAATTSRPAATSPATTAPSTSSAPLSLSGYLAPVDPYEVELKLERFKTPLKITKVVSHGAAVRAGETLIAFDLAEVDEEILQATSDVEVARAAVAKEEVDGRLGAQGDAATLEERADAVADALAAVDWWKKVDGPDFLKRLELSAQAAADGVEDQADELDQLRKMYKSEELTNATADIVVKRAVRQYERSKQTQQITVNGVEKQKATNYVDQGQAADRSLASAKRALEAFNAETAQSKVTRAASLLKARLALKAATKRLGELERDKAMLDVKSKIDGVALYGTFADGTWQGSEADALVAGEETDLSKTLMTVVRPGRLRAIGKVEEAVLFTLRSDLVATVKPTAMPEAKLVGRTRPFSPLTSKDGTFAQEVELDAVDPRLLPGMKVTIEIDGAAK